jgi:raffinose/stachyose/melibiose transport system permease protein
MTTTSDPAPSRADPAPRPPDRRDRPGPRAGARYPYWFLLPAAVVYLVLFIVPTVVSFFFSLTRWRLIDWEFIGLDNFVLFFREAALVTGLVNTLIYGALTSAAKVVLGLLLAVLLTSNIVGRDFLRSVVFFPVLVSTVGVGLTFEVLMDPFDGVINTALAAVGLPGPGWLTDPSSALLSVALVDVWKGVGLATVIYIAGIVSIPREYFEAARVDGAGAWQNFRYIILPLARPATTTVIILSLIGGLRSFDLIWTMTGGGPGFTSDVIASVIYKQYQAGFYGLSTAGNVVLFVVVTAIVVPLFRYLNRKEAEL